MFVFLFSVKPIEGEGSSTANYADEFEIIGEHETGGLIWNELPIKPDNEDLQMDNNHQQDPLRFS